MKEHNINTIDNRPSVVNAENVSINEAIQVWTRVGMLSFGGPAGQIAMMHRILVEEKRWISENHFLHALNFCMLLPGPEAQQLATYIGWVMHRMPGGLIAGTLFIIPGFLVILGLSYLYIFAGHLSLMQGFFLGLKAAVIAIILHAVVRIGTRSLMSNFLRGLAIAAFLAIYIFDITFPYIIVCAAIVGFFAINKSDFVKQENSTNKDVPCKTHSNFYPALKVITVYGFLWLAPVLLLVFLLDTTNVFAGIGLFFSKMAVVTFGGAYAVLSYVAQEAVQAKSWLLPSEMIDGLALAETTPGPLIMVVQFVGFIAAYRNSGILPPGLAAFLGSILTIWVTFVPCFLWIFLGAPHMERLRSNLVLSGVLSAITAAVVGVITNLALWFSIHTLFFEVNTYTFLTIDIPNVSTINIPALLITLIAIVLTFRMRVPIVVTLGISSVLGMAFFLLQ